MKRILIACGIAASVLLTGCSNAGSAATIGDVTITQKSIQSKIDAVLEGRTGIDTSQMNLETGADLNRGQLRFQILFNVFSEIAKELEIELTTAQIAAKRSELIQAVGGEAQLPTALTSAAIAPEDFETYIKLVLISDTLGTALTQTGLAADQVDARISQLLSAKARELKVVVNPRYGKWDYDQGDIIPTSAPAVAPTTAP